MNILLKNNFKLSIHMLTEYITDSNITKAFYVDLAI